MTYQLNVQTQNRKSRFFSFFLFLFLFASQTLGASTTGCETTATMSADETLRGEWVAAGERSCYLVDVAEPGVLVAEARGDAEVWMTVRSCGGRRSKTIRESATRWVLDAAPQDYEVCVSAMDPAVDLHSYRVDTMFAARTAWKSGEDDREKEVDPTGLSGGEDDREKEVDPTGLKSGEDDREKEIDPTERNDGEDDREKEIDPTKARRPAADFGCAARRIDDHADTMTCAEILTDVVEGEIYNDWNDDVDLFKLHSERRRVFRVELIGEAGLRIERLDADGRVLEIFEAGEFRVISTSTDPSFFRIAGENGAEGVYRLRIETLR